MEFRDITEEVAVNEHGNIHVVCSRWGDGCYMPNQVLNNAENDDEREKSVVALNHVGWRIGSDEEIYCPSCVQAIGGD